VIALDTNLLVYAHHRSNPFHSAAKRLVAELAEGNSTWAIPWPCLHEFYNISTNPRLYSPSSTPDEAINQIDIWLESPRLQLLSEDETHWPQLRDLIASVKLQGPMVHDARIAALCLSHGVHELWSADRDFKRFPALRVRNPLI
jgi:toxin-antitoxin system PIN domain toxin